MNPAQEAKLKQLCRNYSVPFKHEHYVSFDEDGPMMAGWVEGWLGGLPGTLFVGVSPIGEAAS